ncbi:S26 family signal peptidase [Geoalkalibacter halelectricus]|uniref:S26 family signal peptidase n=1 Tax=Geoalkalibacter halelectricus TaxID=2847045 RepID=UPI003D2202BD
MATKSNLSPKLFGRFFGTAKVRSQRRYPWWAWALVALCAPVAVFGPSKLFITTTASLPYRIWYRAEVPAAADLKVGHYLAYRKAHPWTDSENPALMVKAIGCLPGQALRIDRGSYYCNDTWLGEALREDSKGNILSPSTFEGIIESGHYFMVGAHPRAWDSKYYGLLKYEEFELYVSPIF